MLRNLVFILDPLKTEFVDLLRVMEWSQAEASRQLHMTTSAVNQIVNPASPVRPSPVTMRLLKLIVATQRPDAIHPETMALKEGVFTQQELKLIEDIRTLSDADRQRVYQIFYGVLAPYLEKHPPPSAKYPPHKPRGKVISSDFPPGMVSGVARAMNKKFAHGAEGSSPSDEAGGSSAPDQPRTRHTGPPSSGRRTTPEQAPGSREGGKDSGHHKK